MGRSKDFPKSPEELWKKRAEGDLDAVLVAGAKTRLAAQEGDKRLRRLGREKIIRRKE